MNWPVLTLRKFPAIILAGMIQAFCSVESRRVRHCTPLWSLSITLVQTIQPVVHSDGPGHFTVTIFIQALAQSRRLSGSEAVLQLLIRESNRAFDLRTPQQVNQFVHGQIQFLNKFRPRAAAPAPTGPSVRPTSGRFPS